MPRWTAAITLLTLLALPADAWAQQTEHKPQPAADDKSSIPSKLGEPHVQKWRFGIVVTSVGGVMGLKTATTTVPMAWPEQKIKIVAQDLSHGVTISYRSYGTAKQLVAHIPRLNDGEESRAIVVMEITRHTLVPPDDADKLVMPIVKSLPAEMKPYLGPSPNIESGHARIKAIAKELAQKASADEKPAWEHVRAIYDWVREKIKYEKDAPLTSCLEAIDKGTGDCNELTSTFIAICRASGIPARTVRIPGHCYPEFYLEDGHGRGDWFPAEASGSDSFGGIFTTGPILQKGDSFKFSLPDANSPRSGMKTSVYRFLPETLVGGNANESGRPKLKLICEPSDG